MKQKNKTKELCVRLAVLLLSAVLSACRLPALPGAVQTSLSATAGVPDQSALDEAYHLRIDLGQVRHLEDSSADYLIKADFPVFEKPALDALIKQVLESELNEFKLANKNFKAEDPEFRAELNVHCATYRIDEERFTLLFQQLRNDGGSAHPFVRFRVAYFDLHAERELSRDELLAPGYLDALAAYSDAFFKASATFKPLVDDELYRAGIAAKPENYRNLIVKADGFDLIFDRYQLFAGFMGEPAVNIGLTAIPALKIRPASSGSSNAPPSTSRAETMPAATAETSAAAGPTTQASAADTGEKPQADQKLIALSFDDGPYSPVDQLILDALKPYGGHATFFMLGNRLASYPDAVKRIHTEGHEIGNHSNTHPNLSELDAVAVKSELDAMDQALERLIGQRSRIIRPTYGALSKTLRECAGRPLINWSVDTLDWKTRDAGSIYNEILKSAADGAIVLMHDLYPATAEACVKAIPELARRGYRFVTVSELLAARSVNAQPGEVIYACPTEEKQ